MLSEPSPRPLDAVAALTQLGGIAGLRPLLDLTSRNRLRAAVRRGEVHHVARDTYALPTTEAGRAAARLHGVVSHQSAAAVHGWSLKSPSPRPHVTVPRGRNVARSRRAGVALHWQDLDADDVEGGVTSRLRTVVDCAAALPFEEALAVADSALREGKVGRDELGAAGDTIGGTRGRRVRRVARHTDARATNAFESVLRALAIEVGLEVVPQFPIVVNDHPLHPDVADIGRRLAVEAESFRWHSDPEALERACTRYNGFAMAGWTVLRFTWQQVMRRPQEVRDVLAHWV